MAAAAVLVALATVPTAALAPGSTSRRGVCTAASATQAPSLGADTVQAAATGRPAASFEGTAASWCKDEGPLRLSVSGSICMAT